MLFRVNRGGYHGSSFKKIVTSFVLAVMLAFYPVNNAKAETDWGKVVISALSLSATVIFCATLLLLDGTQREVSYQNNKTKTLDEGDKSIKFKDVVGLDNVLLEVKEFVDFMKNPDRYSRLGAKKPSGLLLHGAPGCGKTLIAKAIAGEADCHFIPISGTEFVEVYVGVGPARVRELFESARRISYEKPVIIFIDEMDGLGSRSQHFGSSEYSNTINEMLKQMDGIGSNENVLVIGATNFMERLDPALLRPGRLDRKVFVPLPSPESRKAIIKYFLNKIALSEKVSKDDIALKFSKRTAGFSGAELKNFINEAAILAGRENKEEVFLKHFENALDKIKLGLESGIVQSKEQLRRTAYHEAGHALIAALFNIPLEKVSILSRSGSLGVTQTSLKHECYSNYTKSELIHELACFYAGFAAEEIIFGEVTPGVSDDLKRAAMIAQRMVNDFGMAEGAFHAIPKIAIESSSSEKVFDESVVKLLRETFVKAKDFLIKYKAVLVNLAEKLLEKETLEQDEIYEIIGNTRGLGVAG